MRTCIVAAVVLVLSLADLSPADAHIVYFKDGTVARGTVTIRENTLLVTGGGNELSFPLSTVRAVSFNDEPIAYEQQRLEESKALNHEPLIWSWVAANVVGVIATVIGLMR